MTKKNDIKHKLDNNIQNAFSKVEPYTFDDFDILEEKLNKMLNNVQLPPADIQDIIRCCMETVYYNKISIQAYINTTLQSVIPDLKAQLLTELKSDLTNNNQTT